MARGWRTRKLFGPVPKTERSLKAPNSITRRTVHVEVEKSGPCEARVAFQVPAQEYQRRLQDRLVAVGRQAKLKGFRPGKVPAGVVQKLYGAEVERETIESFLREAYETAVKEHKLRPAAHPQVAMDALKPAAGADLSHSFDLALKPTFTLRNYEGLAAERKEITATDEEVEAAILDVRRQQAVPEPAGDDGLVEQGLALARVELWHGGELVVARDGLRLGLGTTPNGVDTATYKEAMAGKREGETGEMPIVFPENFEKAELRGKEGQCRVILSQVFRLVLPEEEQLLRMFRAADGPELRAKVKEQLLEAKRQQDDQRIEQELFAQVLDDHPMELPKNVLESQIEGRFATARQQLTEQGVAPEEIEAQLDADRQATRDAAERSLRALYLVEAIGEKAELRIGQDDLVAELRRIAQRNRASVEEVRDYYEKNGLFQQLAVELLERKVKRLLRERSTAGQAS